MKVPGLAPSAPSTCTARSFPPTRGRAPINWAVLHGEPRIGMTLHRMVKAPDAGAIVDQEGVDIGPRGHGGAGVSRKGPALRPAGPWPPDRRASVRDGYGGRAGCLKGNVLWGKEARGRAHRLGEVLDRDLQPDPGRHRAEPGRLCGLRRSAPHGLVGRADTPPRRSPVRGRPGEVLSVSPLVVATGDGAIELTKVEWQGTPPALSAGLLL